MAAESIVAQILINIATNSFLETPLCNETNYVFIAQVNLARDIYVLHMNLMIFITLDQRVLNTALLGLRAPDTSIIYPTTMN